MLINELNKLFVYVPLGYGQQFIDNYAQSSEYKQKIAFVADTKEIYTNGVGFGVAKGEFQSLVQLVNSNADRIAALENKQEGDASTINDRLDVLEGDASTAGSVAYAVQQLKEEILGSDDLIETLDTIKEIQDWIDTHGTDFLDLSNKVDENTAAIEAETARATAAETALDERVTDLEDITIWDTFSTDEMPVDENTVIMGTPSDLNDITDTQNTDVVIDTQDAMSYFTNDTNSGVIFNNLSI